ncbi:MAG: hypothetical protein OXC69_04730 [Candidatus Tectomicrobia bacterium]|nr:hypothetical protein [Candidatus Tectomicrobia bacterium]
MSHDGHPMRRRQRLAAYAAMLVFGVPSVVIAVVGGELWPFLDYRMYADSKPTAEVDWLELVGRTREGAVLRLDNEVFIAPFSYSELLRSLYSLDVLGEVDPVPARRALIGLLSAYETQRRLGEHNGPPLERVEVYRLRWAGQPGAADFHEPDSRTLLQSVALPDSMR